MQYFNIFIDLRTRSMIGRSTRSSAEHEAWSAASSLRLRRTADKTQWWRLRRPPTCGAKARLLPMLVRTKPLMSRAIVAIFTSKLCPRLGLRASWRKLRTSTIKSLKISARLVTYQALGRLKEWELMLLRAKAFSILGWQERTRPGRREQDSKHPHS